MIIEKDNLCALAQSLKTALHDGRRFEANQVRIIGLDDIKARSGEKWSRIADKVRATATDFLSRRLAPEDVLIQAGDGFIVIFMDAAQAETRRLALQLALNRFYIGEPGIGQVHVEMDHEAISAEMLVRILIQLDADEQASKLEDASPAAPPTRRYVFCPAWSVAQEMITSYWISVRQDDGPQGASNYGMRWAQSGAHSDCDWADLDLDILDTAVRSVKQSLAAGTKCLTGYTVHMSTLQHRSRRQLFLGRLNAVPPEVRPYLFSQIAEFENGTPMAALADWVHQIRAVTQRVAVELHSSQRDLGGLQDIGLTSVACTFSASQTLERKRLAGLIRSWAPQLKRQGLRFRLLNLLDRSLLSEAVDAGVDFISCEGLWPAVDQPKGVRPFKQQEFIDQAGPRRRSPEGQRLVPAK